MAMPKFFKLDLGIPRSDELRKITGKYIRVVAASSQSAAVLVSVEEIWADDSKIPLKAQAEIMEGDGFKYLYFSNAAQPGEWVRIMVSDGPDDFNINYPADVSLSGEVTVVSGNTIDANDFTVDTSEELVVAADAARKALTIVNTTEDKTLLIGPSGSVKFPLTPGAAFTANYAAQSNWYAKGSSAGTTGAYLEEKKV